MKIKTYIYSLFYLVIGGALTMGAVTFVVYLLAKIYLFISGFPFYVDLPGLVKSLKAMLSAGAICGIGCWCIYFWNRKK